MIWEALYISEVVGGCSDRRSDGGLDCKSDGFSGYVSRSVPNAKSHLVTRIQTPSLSPRRHLSEVPRPDRSHKSVLIISYWTQWASSHHTPSHRQNSSRCGHP